MSSGEVEEILSKELAATPEEAEKVWSSVLDRMSRALRSGRSVTLVHIGTLTPYTKQASVYRHPKSGAIEEIPERKHIRLQLSPTMKHQLRAKQRA